MVLILQYLSWPQSGSGTFIRMSSVEMAPRHAMAMVCVVQDTEDTPQEDLALGVRAPVACNPSLPCHRAWSGVDAWLYRWWNMFFFSQLNHEIGPWRLCKGFASTREGVHLLQASSCGKCVFVGSACLWEARVYERYVFSEVFVCGHWCLGEECLHVSVRSVDRVFCGKSLAVAGVARYLCGWPIQQR